MSEIVIEQQERHIAHLRAVNSKLLKALKRMRDVRQKQWNATAQIAFVKGQTLLPWPEIVEADAAIAEAEGK